MRSCSAKCVPESINEPIAVIPGGSIVFLHAGKALIFLVFLACKGDPGRRAR